MNSGRFPQIVSPERAGAPRRSKRRQVPKQLRKPGLVRLAGQHLESRLALTTMLDLGDVNPIDSYAGVGFQQNEVATLSASVNGQADPNAGDFTAQIDWGDGGKSSGSLVYLGTNGGFADFEIKGSHVYQQLGTSVPIKVAVTGPAGAATSAQTSQADVAAMPSGIAGTKPAQYGSASPENVVIGLGNVNPIGSFTGVGFQENVVATMSVSLKNQPDSNLSDLHAQINYGDDASWSTGDIIFAGTNGGFANYQVEGSHVYKNPGTDVPIVVYVNGLDGTSASGQTAQTNVSPNPNTMSATALSVAATEGDDFSGAVATFTDTNAAASETDFTATITWGDGGNSPGSITAVAGGFVVSGSHAYAEEGSPAVRVVVTDAGGSSATSNGTASVKDAALSVAGQTVAATEGITFTGTVASFSDADPNGATGDYSATIAWGDGSISSGSIASSGTGFDVSGAHSYASSGTQTITTTISDAGGSQATATSTVTITTAPITLGSLIVIIGTPTQSGTFDLSASVDDSGGHSGSGTETLTIQPAGAAGNPAYKLEVGIEDPNVPAGGDVPIDVTAVGTSGAISGGVNGAASVSLKAGLSTTVYLHNGTGRALVPVPQQAGNYNVQVTAQPSPGILLTGSASINVAKEQESPIPGLLKKGLSFAQGVAETLEKLLGKSFTGVTEFEKEAAEEFEQWAEKLGYAGKILPFTPLVVDLGVLYHDFQEGNRSQFGKDFSEALKDGEKLAVSLEVKGILDVSPLGPVGALLANTAIEVGVENTVDSVNEALNLDPATTSLGENVFDSLKGVAPTAPMVRSRIRRRVTFRDSIMPNIRRRIRRAIKVRPPSTSFRRPAGSCGSFMSRCSIATPITPACKAGSTILPMAASRAISPPGSLRAPNC